MFFCRPKYNKLLNLFYIIKRKKFHNLSYVKLQDKVISFFLHKTTGQHKYIMHEGVVLRKLPPNRILILREEKTQHFSSFYHAENCSLNIKILQKSKTWNMAKAQ